MRLRKLIGISILLVFLLFLISYLPIPLDNRFIPYIQVILIGFLFSLPGIYLISKLDLLNIPTIKVLLKKRARIMEPQIILKNVDEYRYEIIFKDYNYILKEKPLKEYQLETLLKLLDEIESKEKYPHFPFLVETGYRLLKKHYERRLNFVSIGTDDFVEDLARIAKQVVDSGYLERQPPDSTEQRGITKIISREDITPNEFEPAKMNLILFLEKVNASKY